MPTDVTSLLHAIGSGDASAKEELLPMIYDELRQLAAAKMARERAQTLQATELVHEAWMRIGDQRFENRSHFFGAAAEAMRRILVDRARQRNRAKRGAGVQHEELEPSRIVSPLVDEKILLVHAALDELAAEDAIKAKIVKLRYFVGLQHQEIASLLDISEKTVRRHWQVAKIRLFQIMREHERPAKKY